MKVFELYLNFTEICFQVYNLFESNIGADNGFAPKCQQVIIQTKGGLQSNFKYKLHQIPNVYGLENEDVVGAVPIGDAPTTSEWSTILLPMKVQLILKVWQ